MVQFLTSAQVNFSYKLSLKPSFKTSLEAECKTD